MENSGRRRRPFPCGQDLQDILDWEKRLAKAGTLADKPAVASRNPVDWRAVLDKLKLTTSKKTRYELSIVLAKFREERPDSWTREFIWSNRNGKRKFTFAAIGNGAGNGGERNPPPRRWYVRKLYVFEDFRAWLDSQDLAKLAAKLRRKWRPIRLPKAVAFLQFLLTQDTRGFPDIASRRAFGRFLLNAPVGAVLDPLPDPVPQERIRSLAKASGIGNLGIRAAVKALKDHGVNIISRAGGGWRLAAPITIDQPWEQRGSQAICTAGEADQPSGAKRGRRKSAKTAELFSKCYDVLFTGGKREGQLARLQKEVGEKVVPDRPTMLLYARRHAAETGKPWPPPKS